MDDKSLQYYAKRMQTNFAKIWLVFVKIAEKFWVQKHGYSAEILKKFCRATQKLEHMYETLLI